ncbi:MULTISPECIES: response regulator transcription factor [unclassified Brevibacterium]|uniref:response regulator n=1 Tax=unclassified Brevibacterium TaxID=2614124 RepID=UPI001E38B87F|nr:MULTISPECIES: response regulator transcription factor [unclassified Brevibacterium]MCD1285756.1 DNA-binding response regulator [Brevibacterium sp. CCUG 69071]MDK8434815.1 response regulator transcription factor [Brevibacterium sp. H-BE7]
MTGIILVDDQELVRTGLRQLAVHDGDIDVLAEAAEGRAGLSHIRQHRPDVVLMDIRMPVMDGITATREITADPALSGVSVIVLTTFDDDDDIVSAIAAGASGYLLKDISPTELRRAIRTVAAGNSLLSPAVTNTVLKRLSRMQEHTLRPELLETLTQREREVLARVGLGESNQEIGARLFISPETARTYVSRLLGKLDARDRSQLVVLAYESGLVVPGAAEPEV